MLLSVVINLVIAFFLFFEKVYFEIWVYLPLGTLAQLVGDVFCVYYFFGSVYKSSTSTSSLYG